MISRVRRRPWLRRPAAVTGLSVAALAALLAGGLVVAHAVDGAPAASTSASASSATAPGNGTDNVAAGVNTTDGRTVYAIRLKLVQTANDTVDATNAAVAVNASCTGCSTVAIAFEGVLVAGSPSTFDPTNLALAYNSDCSGCTAFADAYQQVVQSSTRVRITGAGRKQVAAVRQDLEALRHEALSLDQVVARVRADEQAFADVLLHDCVPVGHDTTPPSGSDVSDSPNGGTAPSTYDGGTDAATASPGDTSTSPTPGGSTGSSPSPSETPNQAPTPTASP